MEGILDVRGTVLVDQDGVVAGFEEAVLSQIANKYPHIQPLSPAPEVPRFYTADNYPEEYRKEIWAISNEAGFIENLPVVADAVEGWQRIREMGLSPRICSTLLPEEYMPTCREEKIAWLTRHFGKAAALSAIFTPNKHLIPAAALIEDRPAPIKHSEHAVWEHIIFDRPYNRTTQSESYIRLNGWADPDLEHKLQSAIERHRRRLSS